MANVISTGSAYVDSTGTLKTSTVSLHKIILQGSGGDATLVLTDNTNRKSLKLDLTAASGETNQFNFEKPLIFNEGIIVKTATNVKATLILEG